MVTTSLTEISPYFGLKSGPTGFCTFSGIRREMSGVSVLSGDYGYLDPLPEFVKEGQDV